VPEFVWQHGRGAAFGKIEIDDLAARQSRAESSDGAAAKEAKARGRKMAI
jgi:hypothetical protein